MKVAQEVKIRGNFDFYTLPKITRKNAYIIRELRRFQRTNGANKHVIERIKARGLIHRHMRKHNLITTRGRAVLASLLAGDPTYSGQINYGALGSSSTPVNNSDIKLGTEVYRKIYASHTTDGNN